MHGAKDYYLTYMHTDHSEVVGYSNLDFVECIDNRKSTS
jgi:hypothetical protein